MIGAASALNMEDWRGLLQKNAHFKYKAHKLIGM